MDNEQQRSKFTMNRNGQEIVRRMDDAQLKRNCTSNMN